MAKIISNNKEQGDTMSAKAPRESGCPVDPDMGLPSNINPNIQYKPIVRTTLLEDGHVHVVCFIDDSIYQPCYYVELLYVLNQASEGDFIDIIISSPGGMVNSAVIISNAIKASKAEVTTIAAGLCASSGALIWAAGDVRKVEHFGSIMFHGTTHFDYAKSSEVKENAEDWLNYFSYILSIYHEEGILTDEELDKIENLKLDVYIDADTMIKRLQRNRGLK